MDFINTALALNFDSDFKISACIQAYECFFPRLLVFLSEFK
jgi:hypothetical protein